MTNVFQHSIVLNSQSHLRTADSLARDWAIAHAGPYQGQARRELGGSDPFRLWQNDSLTVRIAKLSTATYRQLQLVAVTYDPSDGLEPYVGYILTAAGSETGESGGRFISVVSPTENTGDRQPPWNERAGLMGLEKMVESITGERSEPPTPSGQRPALSGVDDLFDNHDMAIVITEDGQSDAEFQELAATHGDWVAVVAISAKEQLVIGRELPAAQLTGWVSANIAFFSRHPDASGSRLRMMESDPVPAAIFLDEERDRFLNSASGRNAVDLLKILESVSTQLSVSLMTDAKVMAEALMDASAGSNALAGETESGDDVATQQRIYTLEDQLNEAENTIAQLQERIAQYESYEIHEQNEDEDEDGDVEPESILDSNRHIAVLDAITNPERFPRLRFLTNCEKELPGYGKPRPTGVEIVAALEAINKLASAWYNTPSRNIGTWDNFFLDLTGWKHADGESDQTIGKFGNKRSFSDQEYSRHVEITRHLTYQGSSGGLQIYFDKDDRTENFIVGYIGEHLPYASSPS